MADTAARLAICARRNEVARFTIAVTGIDLTGVAMAMQIRLGRDVPGAPLISLATVTTLAAEGLKLDSVTVTNGVPTSVIKGRINASTMTDATKVPYTGEVGDNTVLAYAMQWTIGGDPQTRLYGDFIVVASAFGSDGAPTNRPASYGSSSASCGGANSGSLTFGDQVIAVTLAASDLTGLEVAKAAAAAATAVAARDGILNNAGFITVSTDLALGADSKISIVSGGMAGVNAVAADLALGASGSYILRAPAAATNAAASATSAATARDKAQEWAEGAGAPGAAGSQSAKSWASAAAGSAQAAGTAATPVASDLIARSTPINRNIFDKTATTASTVLRNSDGQPVALAGYYVTDFMAVRPGQSVSVSAASYANATYGYSWFDALKGRISGSSTAAAPGTPIVAPAGAYFLRMTFANAVASAGLMVVNGSAVPTFYQGFNEPSAALTLSLVPELIAKSTPRSRNLFDKDAITAGNLMAFATGVLTASGGYYVTDFMDVLGLTGVTPSHPSFGNAAYGYSFFDQNKVWLSGSGSPLVAGTQLAVPAGAVFLRVTLLATAAPAADLMIMSGASVPANYQPFNAPEQFSYLNAAVAAAAKGRRKRLNLFDRDGVTTGQIPLMSTGALVTASSYSTTDYFPVQPGSGIKVFPASISVGAAYGLTWHDKDFRYLGGVAAPFTDDQVFTPPANAVFARLPFNNTQIDTLVILPVGITRDANPAAHRAALLTDASQWAGKAICQIGDSISQALAGYGRWLPDMHKRLNSNFTLDAARGGRAMVDALKDLNGTALTQAQIQAQDAVNIWLGTNDYGGNTPLGTISDPVTAATFFGYTKKAVEQLLTWNPTLLVSLTTPMYRTGGSAPNTVGATLADYQQAIRDVAQFYNIPLHDMARVSGISAFNAATLLYDGLHPNVEGLRLMSARFVGFYRAQAPNIVFG